MKRLLRILMLLSVRLLGARDAYAASCRRTPTTSPRILLLRPDHLGDLVLTTPVLDALKVHAPDVSITMMVGPWSSEVVARHPAIDRLLTCPFPGFQRAPQRPLAPYILLFRIAQQLRRGNYDLAINLRPDFWWGAALFYLAAIPRRIGYSISPGAPFLTDAEVFHRPEHATVSNLRLVSKVLSVMNKPPIEEPYTPERYPLVFTPTDTEQKWVAERLQEAHIEEHMPIAVIHAGTGAAVKLWRTEAWAACANMMTTTLTFPVPMRIILTGSKSEESMLKEIASNMTSPPLIVTNTTVGQLAALLKRATLVLGVDNGPLHLAVAQGTPTIQIFGPTDKRIFGPWGSPERHRVIASTHRCLGCPTIPCGRLDIRPEELAAHPCVRLVSEQQVEEAIMSLVGNRYITPNSTRGSRDIP